MMEDRRKTLRVIFIFFGTQPYLPGQHPINNLFMNRLVSDG